MSFLNHFSAQQTTHHLDQYFRSIQSKTLAQPIQVRVFSAKHEIDYIFPAGSEHKPYHIASIGKVFTAVLIQRLADRGMLSLRDPITRFLPHKELDRLFVYRGKDYADQVTVEQLLGHTSGVADYFEGKTISGKSFIDDVLRRPDTFWTPQTLLDFTRNNQTAVGAPGEKFNYSDTGYILLGLIVEMATGKSFAKNLEDDIFHPLELRDSYLMFYSEASDQLIEKIWFNGTEISGFKSLSCDWAGGGIISSTSDLLKFNRALREGKLVRQSALDVMDICPNKFQAGIYYGLGMMEIRFKDFFFLLGHLPKVKGHIGVISTHLFYDPIHDTHIVMNFGNNAKMVASFKALIEIENTLQRMK